MACIAMAPRKAPSQNSAGMVLGREQVNAIVVAMYAQPDLKITRQLVNCCNAHAVVSCFAVVVIQKIRAHDCAR